MKRSSLEILNRAQGIEETHKRIVMILLIIFLRLNYFSIALDWYRDLDKASNGKVISRLLFYFCASITLPVTDAN